MARKLRVQFAGAIYHVTFRGNARQATFADVRDRKRLTARVAESAEDFAVCVYLIRRIKERARTDIALGRLVGQLCQGSG